MKLTKYLLIIILFFEVVVNLLPNIFRPFLDINFGIITLGKLFGIVLIIMLVKLILEIQKI